MSASDPVGRPAAAEAGVFLGTFAVLLLAMGGLFSADTVLAKMERTARQSEAHGLFSEGVQLAGRHEFAAAVDRLQGALADERTNPLYQRALASALLGASDLTGAGTLLNERLQQQPTDAEASLLMARVLARQGKHEDAVSYYHRAIYGHWDDDPAGSRIAARFELVELLVRMGNRRELLAELLPLQDAALNDIGTRRRIARLFTDAGSPARAAEIFSELVKNDGDDAESWAGLADAEFAEGAYRTAETYFVNAMRAAPGDSAVWDRLALTRRILSLDPMQRGIGGAEQLNRSVALLGLTLSAAESCAGVAASQSDSLLADSARVAISAVRVGGERHDAVNRNLDLAERLWAERQSECPGPPRPGEEPVALVLRRAAD
ncbi:MAG: tetratricopeptide repeat protein [Gemmatimonadota bacterium]